MEHLIVQGAIEGFPPNAASTELNQIGIANAETMPGFTHFDYITPTNTIELVLKIESGRLQTLKISPELIQQEIPKCYRETITVENNPAAGLLKHAFMALNQGWAHGATKALVKGGLENISQEQLENFHAQFYQPRNLILVLAGDFKPADGLGLVKKYFGGAVSRTPAEPAGIKWEALSELAVQWDVKTRAFCLAYPPPSDSRERLLLTLWGNLLYQKLNADPDLQLSLDFSFCSNQSWPAGQLPFFVYAVPKTNETLLHLQKLLKEKARFWASRRISDSDVAQLKVMLAALWQSAPISWSAIRQQAQNMAEQLRQPTSYTAGLVMGNLAVQQGMRELLLDGLQSHDLSQMEKQLTPETLQQLIARTLDPAREVSTALIPAE
jgi:predicted Zn-dependent peptidase